MFFVFLGLTALPLQSLYVIRQGQLSNLNSVKTMNQFIMSNAILTFFIVPETKYNTDLLVWHVDLAQLALHWILGDILHLQEGLY